MSDMRRIRQKNDLFDANIEKRGNVPASTKKSGLTVGPVVLGVFLFVVVGSALLQIIRTAMTGRD